MEHEQPDVTSSAEFDALIRANGWRFVLAVRLRSWAWRFVHEPAWAQGLIAATTLFGAPGVGACAHQGRRPDDELVAADSDTR